MAKLLETPEAIKVKSTIMGVPISITRRGKLQQVDSVYQHWRVADEWWRKEMARDYFRIRTSGALLCDIYRDMVDDRWYLSRIHD